VRIGGADDLGTMQRIVQHDWTPDSHWHIGDLAWERPAIVGRRIALWDDVAWATVSESTALAMHAPPEMVGEVLAWFDEVASGENGQSGSETAQPSENAQTSGNSARAAGDSARAGGDSARTGSDSAQAGGDSARTGGDSARARGDDGRAGGAKAPAGGARTQTVSVMESDKAVIDALLMAGYRPWPVERTFFLHCLRDLDDTLPAPRLPDGYRVRPVQPGELAARAGVHRAAWRPKRLGHMQVPAVDLGEGESSMTTARLGEIIGHWPYRSDLDQVVEGPDGTLVATALGWIDDVNRSALLEPVGVAPEHSRKGLGAAVSLACLHAMREAGATQAVVCPRGDDAYPVPRRLYHAIGFRDSGRTVTYQRDRA
jgi:GNAT superfamily N-acetyltransferase